MAKPVLKWVGGKRRLLPEIQKRVPSDFLTYFEPFVGGGALFFSLSPAYSVLGDSNERLVRTYRAIRNNVDAVIAELRSYPYSKDFYLQLRSKPIDSASDVEIAAWMIYLNRTGFNGLYRVNKNNVFNVPFGKYKHPTICDKDALKAASGSLQSAEIHCADFQTIAERASKNDFVYFDPPYSPLTSDSFIAYTPDRFGTVDQIRLSTVARNLKRRGVHVLISNSNSDEVRSLYADFEMSEVQCSRPVNCNATGRGKVKELLIW